MGFLIVLVIFWTYYVVAKSRSGEHDRALGHTATTSVRRAVGNPDADIGSRYETAWSAWDDRKLTQLLTDWAPRTTTHEELE